MAVQIKLAPVKQQAKNQHDPDRHRRQIDRRLRPVRVRLVFLVRSDSFFCGRGGAQFHSSAAAGAAALQTDNRPAAGSTNTPPARAPSPWEPPRSPPAARIVPGSIERVGRRRKLDLARVKKKPITRHDRTRTQICADRKAATECRQVRAPPIVRQIRPDPLRSQHHRLIKKIILGQAAARSPAVRDVRPQFPTGGPSAYGRRRSHWRDKLPRLDAPSPGGASG